MINWTPDSPIPKNATWALTYSTIGAPFPAALERLSGSGVQTFGATSFNGVLLPTGFERGAFALIGDDEDPVAHSVSRATDEQHAHSAAREAAEELAAFSPDVLLLHATPGFEERILEGVRKAFNGTPPPLYGGSAADDNLEGSWRVFHGTETIESGFVLTAFTSPKPVHGSFVAGYTPGTLRGRVTSASGRLLRSIDDRPAAKVYNEWLNGALESKSQGGVVLAETTLSPLGHIVDRVGAMDRYLLIHPHRIEADGSIQLFAEVSVGDELVLMLGSREALFDRTEQVASRAGRRAGKIRGGVLIYCAGCVGVTGDGTAEVAKRFSAAIGDVPFIGAATYGEQGSFRGRKPVNRHGNLMADAVLFE